MLGCKAPRYGSFLAFRRWPLFCCWALPLDFRSLFTRPHGIHGIDAQALPMLKGLRGLAEWADLKQLLQESKRLRPNATHNRCVLGRFFGPQMAVGPNPCPFLPFGVGEFVLGLMSASCLETPRPPPPPKVVQRGACN